MPYASINPYTSELVKSYPDATDAEVAVAIDQAHAAFLTWKRTGFAARATVMRAAADLLRRQCDDYARLLTLEMGKLFSEARAEVALAARCACRPSA